MNASVWIGAAATFGATWFPLAVLTLRAQAQTRALSDVLDDARDRRDPERTPTLSVVVTACDEEAEIEGAVRALLEQDYADLEIVVVNDRSKDRTGEILDRVAAEPATAGRLVVVHNRDLPAGWLGKCNACRLGADRTRGAWILFLDGDVRLAAQDLLARVVAAAEHMRLDHVAVLPDLRPQSVAQEAMTNVFGWFYLLGARAWQMDKDYPRGGGGVGAFNLVRRSAYERVGGYATLRMDVADDYKLGRLLKESGARQRIYVGRDLVRCPWHRGALATIRGLEKNFFAGFDYSLPRALATLLFIPVLAYGPTILLLAAMITGAFAADQRVAAAVVAPFFVQFLTLIVSLFAYGPRTGARVLPALLYPLGMALTLVAIVNSAYRTLRRGGILWRGTFYPLAALRAAVVPEGAGKRFRSPPPPK